MMFLSSCVESTRTRYILSHRRARSLSLRGHHARDASILLFHVVELHSESHDCRLIDLGAFIPLSDFDSQFVRLVSSSSQHLRECLILEVELSDLVGEFVIFIFELLPHSQFSLDHLFTHYALDYFSIHQ